MSNSSTRTRTFKHLTAEQRGIIQAMHQAGHTQEEISETIGVNQSTISRELKRGKTRQMDYNGRYYDIYLAESGSRVYKDNRKNCQTKGLQAFSLAFLKALEKALLTKKEKRRYSVDTFVHIYQREHPLERVPCTKTVYQWIDQGLLAIKNIDLPMKTRMRKRKAASKPKGQNTKMLGRSIDLRCESVLSREEFRHWELDLVIGKQTKGEPVIITLLERKTRKYLTKKVWSKCADSIQTAVKSMIEIEGKDRFKTLTTDNGSEFSTLSLLESEVEDLQVFFAHAYSAWEKGSNERHNRMLREFIPKGKSLKDLKYKDLALYTQAINNRFRKCLNYQCPNDLYEEEVKRLTA